MLFCVASWIKPWNPWSSRPNGPFWIHTYERRCMEVARYILGNTCLLLDPLTEGSLKDCSCMDENIDSIRSTLLTVGNSGQQFGWCSCFKKVGTYTIYHLLAEKSHEKSIYRSIYRSLVETGVGKHTIVALKIHWWIPLRGCRSTERNCFTKIRGNQMPQGALSGKMFWLCQLFSTIQT